MTSLAVKIFVELLWVGQDLKTAFHVILYIWPYTIYYYYFVPQRNVLQTTSFQHSSIFIKFIWSLRCPGSRLKCGSSLTSSGQMHSVPSGTANTVPLLSQNQKPPPPLFISKFFLLLRTFLSTHPTLVSTKFVVWCVIPEKFMKCWISLALGIATAESVNRTSWLCK